MKKMFLAGAIVLVLCACNSQTKTTEKDNQIVDELMAKPLVDENLTVREKALLEQRYEELKAKAADSRNRLTAEEQKQLDELGAYYEQVKSQVRTKTDEVRNTVDNAVDNAKDAVEDAKDNVSDALNDAKGKVQSAADNAADKVSDAAGEVKDGAVKVGEDIKEAAGNVKDAFKK